MKLILGFFRKEFAQTLRDPVMRLFIFVAPIVQLTLFGYAISNEFKNIKLSLVFNPSDYMARQLSEKFYASGYFKPKSSDTADIVIIPHREGLTKSYERKEAEIQLLIDSTNATKARAIENYSKTIISNFFLKILSVTPPIFFDIRLLYNPTMETSYFMVPGVMTMLICLITVMLTGMSMAREKELGTFETIIAAPLTSTEIVLGKTIPFIVLGMVNALIVVAAGIIIFNVPCRGSFLLILFASFVFVCTTVSIGTLISTFAKNQQQAMMGSFLFIFPANLMSGVMFPIENMPEALKLIAYLNPLKYFASLLRNIMLKGINFGLAMPDLLVLLLMSVIIISVTISRFKQTMN